MDDQRFDEIFFSRERRARVTLALILANVLVFFISAGMAGSITSVGSMVTLPLGANHAPLVMHGQPWRLLTAMFLHGGILHVGLNMLALFESGSVAERLFGSRGMFIIYFGAGLVGNVVSMWWHPQAVSVGASGAVFGVYGAILAYLRAQPGSLPASVFNRIRVPTVGFVLFSLWAGAAMPGVDNGAHVGGLFGGIVLGYALARPLDVTAPLRLAAPRVLAACALLLALCTLLWWRVQVGPVRVMGAQRAVSQAPSDHGLGQAAAQLTLEEAMLLARTNGLLDNLRKEAVTPAEAVQEIRTEMLPRWELQLKTLRALALPPGVLAQHRDKLVRYVELRRDALAMIAEGIETRNAARLDEANSLQAEADALVAEGRE